MSCATVVVFARRPRPGRVKTRLARVIGGVRAASHYRMTLQRMLALVDALPGVRRVLLCTQPVERSWFRARLSGHRWRVGAQHLGDLGQRMKHALDRYVAPGCPALLVGSDVLDASLDDLQAAVTRLRAGTDVVLGPAADGGYWLIGIREESGDLFRDIPWSTDQVLPLTLERAAAKRRTVYLLQARHDLDRAADLLRRAPGFREKLRRSRRGDSLRGA